MPKISLSDSFVQLMKQKHLADKQLLLIADDGGGRYSLQGGACSIGTKFTLIVLDQPDPDYQIPLTNAEGLHLATSSYDQMFFNPGLRLDFNKGLIALKDDGHALDDAVRIAKGKDVLAAFQQGIRLAGTTC